MKEYKTAVAVMYVRYCMECPFHNVVMQRKMVRVDGTYSRWIMEPLHAICKKTGKIVRLTGMDRDCPLDDAAGIGRVNG